MSRPSCLGEKSRQSEELLREPQLRDLGLDAGQSPGRSIAEAWPGPLEKPPAPVENGWSPVPSAGRSRPGSPVLKRSLSEVAVQNGSTACVPLKGQGQAGGAAWTPPRASAPRSAWSWKPVTTREVTEVTEVTETIVTEIVEVTEYPAGEKGGEPLVTRTVTVLTERAGELAAGGRSGHTDAAEVTAGQGPSPLKMLRRPHAAGLLCWHTCLRKRVLAFVSLGWGSRGALLRHGGLRPMRWPVCAAHGALVRAGPTAPPTTPALWVGAGHPDGCRRMGLTPSPLPQLVGAACPGGSTWHGACLGCAAPALGRPAGSGWSFGPEEERWSLGSPSRHSPADAARRGYEGGPGQGQVPPSPGIASPTGHSGMEGFTPAPRLPHGCPPPAWAAQPPLSPGVPAGCPCPGGGGGHGASPGHAGEPAGLGGGHGGAGEQPEAALGGGEGGEGPAGGAEGQQIRAGASHPRRSPAGD